MFQRLQSLKISQFSIIEEAVIQRYITFLSFSLQKWQNPLTASHKKILSLTRQESLTHQITEDSPTEVVVVKSDVNQDPASSTSQNSPATVIKSDETDS